MKTNISPVLLFILFGLTFSLISTLFFAWVGWTFAIISCLLIAIRGFWNKGKKTRISPKYQLPNFKKISFILGIIAALACIITFPFHFGTGLGETDGLPVFAKREHYFLNNHGKLTEVSRIRFLLVDTGFILCLHFGFACIAIEIFGE